MILLFWWKVKYWQENHYQRETEGIEAKICTIACFNLLESHFHSIIKVIAKEVIYLEWMNFIMDNISIIKWKNELKP